MSRFLRWCGPNLRSTRPDHRALPKKPVFHRYRSSFPEEPKYTAKKQTLLNPTVVVIGFIPILCFALGTWQIDRLKWKVNLIDELQEKLQREPLALPRHINLTVVPDFVFRRVYLTGCWDHDRTMFLGPRTRDGMLGYHVVTPLIRSEGSTVLVDRGFVSQNFIDASTWSKEKGEVEVLGMLRIPQKRNAFTPDNQPEKNVWYWADVETMAKYAGNGTHVQPVYIEEIFDGHAGDVSTRLAQGIPAGKPAVVDVRNSHASYIVTWYSLSALTAVMFARLLLKQHRSQPRMPRFSQ